MTVHTIEPATLTAVGPGPDGTEQATFTATTHEGGEGMIEVPTHRLRGDWPVDADQPVQLTLETSDPAQMVTVTRIT